MSAVVTAGDRAYRVCCSRKPNCVVPEHPSPSHRLRRVRRNLVISPDGDPLRMHRRRVGLEVTELLLLLLGVQPPFNGFSPGA